MIFPDGVDLVRCVEVKSYPGYSILPVAQSSIGRIPGFGKKLHRNTSRIQGGAGRRLTGSLDDPDDLQAGGNQTIVIRFESCNYDKRLPGFSCPLRGYFRWFHLSLAPGKSCRHSSSLSFGRHLPSPNSLRFCPKSKRGVRFTAKIKTGPGYPNRCSSRRSGSDPESRRITSRISSGSRVPRIEAPLLIPIPPESGAVGPLSGKRLSATKYLHHLVS